MDNCSGMRQRHACIIRCTEFRPRCNKIVYGIQPIAVHNVRFCVRNIKGVTKAILNDNLIGSFLKQFDVIFLSETCTDENSQFDLEGFVYINYSKREVLVYLFVANYSKR